MTTSFFDLKVMPEEITIKRADMLLWAALALICATLIVADLRLARVERRLGV